MRSFQVAGALGVVAAVAAAAAPGAAAVAAGKGAPAGAVRTVCVARVGRAAFLPPPAIVRMGPLLGVSDIARALDMSAARLRAEMRKGLTVARIAAKEGKDRAAFVAAVRRIVRAKVRADVAKRAITGAAADKILRAAEALASRLWTMPAIPPLPTAGLPPLLAPRVLARKGGRTVVRGRGAPLAFAAGAVGCKSMAAAPGLAVTPSLIAQALGVSTAQLRRAVASGITVAAVATAHGLDRARFFARMQSIVRARLHKEVAAGRMTAAQERAALLRLKDAWAILWSRTATPARVGTGSTGR